jgi:hypothetical protein
MTIQEYQTKGETLNVELATAILTVTNCKKSTQKAITAYDKAVTACTTCKTAVTLTKNQKIEATAKKALDICALEEKDAEKEVIAINLAIAGNARMLQIAEIAEATAIEKQRRIDSSLGKKLVQEAIDREKLDAAKLEIEKANKAIEEKELKEKQEAKLLVTEVAIASCIDEATAMVNCHTTFKEKAIALLAIAGYVAGCNKATAIAALEIAKRALFNAFTLKHGVLNTSDAKSEAALEYKSMCQPLERLTRIERTGQTRNRVPTSKSKEEIAAQELIDANKKKEDAEKLLIANVQAGTGKEAISGIVQGENGVVKAYTGVDYSSDVISFNGCIEDLCEEYFEQIASCIKLHHSKRYNAL